MPGLVPGIPLSKALGAPPKRDGRDKPGHDDDISKLSQ
jgi:hypothetical protein